MKKPFSASQDFRSVWLNALNSIIEEEKKPLPDLDKIKKLKTTKKRAYEYWRDGVEK